MNTDCLLAAFPPGPPPQHGRQAGRPGPPPPFGAPGANLPLPRPQSGTSLIDDILGKKSIKDRQQTEKCACRPRKIMAQSLSVSPNQGLAKVMRMTRSSHSMEAAPQRSSVGQ